MQRGVIGAVLAGGASSRMGTDKAEIEISGSSLLSRVVATVRRAGIEPVVVGRTQIDADAVAIPDPPGRHGPAAGLLAALDYAPDRDVLLVATDQPFMRTESIRRLVATENGDAIIPVAGGWPQVTFAVYRSSCRPALVRLLDADPAASLRRLLKRVAVREVAESEWASWGETGDSWWSIDTPEDLAEARSRL